MLILRRKVGEAFLVGNDISITILDTDSNGTVNIGINAPRDVLILRSELQQAASTNQDSASTFSTPGMVKALENVLRSPAAPSQTEKQKETK